MPYAIHEITPVRNMIYITTEIPSVLRVLIVFMLWGAVQNDGHYFCGTGGNRPDGLNEPVTILAEDVSVRLIGIKFFADSKMDEFIKDLGEKLNDGNPLEGSSLSLF